MEKLCHRPGIPVRKSLRANCSKSLHFCTRCSTLHTFAPQLLEKGSHPPAVFRTGFGGTRFSMVSLKFPHFNLTTMNDLLYVIAVILIIGWLLGAFVFSVGSIIHLLLVIAVVAILLRLIRGRSV
jgi:hypothetical protein